MIKQVKNLLASLTILPVRMDQDVLTDSANYMFLFPLIGAFVGLLTGAAGWALFRFLPGLVVGVLLLGLLLLLTGLHHTDGLLDLGDALMYNGTAERKIEIMHDQLTGAGGLGLGMITILTTAIALGYLGPQLVLPALVVLEAGSRLSMVVGAWAGRSVHEGMS